MKEPTIDTVWRNRLSTITSEVSDINFPDSHDRDSVGQDEEWCEVVVGGQRRRIRFHDYHEIYETPGLFEQLFYERLKCCSPSRTAGLLYDVLEEENEPMQDLMVLDLGAGNGMVGDELRARRSATIVGIDILPEARTAARRDRPGVYDDYLVADLTDLPQADERRLRDRQFNCLTTVAALGFNDIPPQAFIRALDLIGSPAWIALTIKEDFLYERDPSGFSHLIRQLCRHEIIQIQAYRRFQHRLSMTGEPLHYVAMIARKLRDTGGWARDLEDGRAISSL